MNSNQIYYLFCNHWTQGGIGYAFPSGHYNGKKYDRTFSSVYTINKMLDAADDYPGLKVSMELDSFCYEEVLKEDPACIDRLKRYIKEGKAGIDGGTYGQPFGQDYGWEPNIRQLTYGRQSAQEVLDYDVKAFLVEEQWFHPQLPQLLLLSGFKYASLQNQNSGQVMPMNEAIINWVGMNGSKLPTVPANDLLVSCVRQYTDYSTYVEKLNQYERPLLFQWVEVWAPGMDWGASGTPFEKGINQVQNEWNGKSVTLGEYLELEAHQRKLKDVYIPMDESNYVNNWYQDGGWGYDGDRVIMLDKKTEQKVLAYEILSTIEYLKNQSVYPKDELIQIWKKLMTLQNHDFSAARGYRVYSEEGHITNAGSLATVEYGKLKNQCQVLIENKMLNKVGNHGEEFTVVNPTAIAHKRTLELEVPISSSKEDFIITSNDKQIQYQRLQQIDGKMKVLAPVELPSLSNVTVKIEKKNAYIENNAEKIQLGQTWIEDENIRVEWIKDTWKAKIVDKRSGQSVTFAGFTGPIAKVNEHDGKEFPALSPGHEEFSFAFDGTTHSPDQLTWPKALVEKAGSVQSTLKIYSNILTLHTTSTPVAFAETRVNIDHLTGRVECESYLYTGVWLSLQCWAEFTHDIKDAKYYRDFPFGEEETNIEMIYPNTYSRVASDESGFTLVHPGVQRANIQRNENGGTIRHLIARDKVMGDYVWKFVLNFGKHQPWESMAISQVENADIFTANGSAGEESFLENLNQKIMLSALYQEYGGTVVRLVNFSPDEVENSNTQINHLFSNGNYIDFMGNVLGDADLNLMGGKTQVTLSFKPWEIITLVLK